MKPHYRYYFSSYLWKMARSRYSLFRGYAAFHPQGNFSVSYEQVFGPVFRASATEDCHTTGSALRYVDPKTLRLL